MNALGLHLAVALFAMSAIVAPALAGKKDNSVRFAFEQALENADPYSNSQRVGVILGQQVWDTLIYRDPRTGEYNHQFVETIHAPSLQKMEDCLSLYGSSASRAQERSCLSVGAPKPIHMGNHVRCILGCHVQSGYFCAKIVVKARVPCSLKWQSIVITEVAGELKPEREP